MDFDNNSNRYNENPIEESIFKFAFMGTIELFDQKLKILADKALPESWNNQNLNPNEFPILKNYIIHTFKRLAFEHNNNLFSELEPPIYFSDDNNKACFNTGLFTKQYEYIYACFKKNDKEESQEWFFVSFSDSSDPFLIDVLNLPRRAKYFTSLKDLIYDTSAELRINSAHILSNENNIKRLPAELQNSPYLQTLFNGAVDLAKKKVEANYKAAVPQFFNNEICFLLPICLQNTEKADVSLAVRWHNGYYTGHTCLSLEMAYNNARLITCPNSEWLTPNK